MMMMWCHKRSALLMVALAVRDTAAGTHHVIDAGVQTRLIEDRDASSHRRLMQDLHLRGGVAGGDHVLVVADGGLGNVRVAGGGHQGDDEVVGGHQRVQLLVLLRVGGWASRRAGGGR